MTLDPRLLLQAYAMGIFPMADSRSSAELFWVEPRERAIIPLDGFHLSRSLARTLRSERFTVTLDQNFAGVIAGCADRAETWINRDIEQAMLSLHGLGHAHSIEVRADGELVGGIYGVKLGRAFFAESMFSRRTDASKVALAWLVARLKAGGYTLLDCQFLTDHLASLGAVAVPRSTYAVLLSAALGGGADGAGDGSAGGAAGADPPPEFLELDRLLAAGAPDGDFGQGGAAREGHRAASRPDVIDRVLDDVERRRLLVQPAREHPAPALVGPLDLELDEGAGQPLILPRRGCLAGAQPDDRVLHAERLAGLHRQVADDAVALVQKADHRDPFGHRRHPGRRSDLGALPACLGTLLIFAGRLAAAAGRERQRGSQDRDAHVYSGVQGK